MYGRCHIWKVTMAARRTLPLRRAKPSIYGKQAGGRPTRCRARRSAHFGRCPYMEGVARRRGRGRSLLRAIYGRCHKGRRSLHANEPRRSHSRCRSLPRAGLPLLWSSLRHASMHAREASLERVAGRAMADLPYMAERAMADAGETTGDWRWSRSGVRAHELSRLLYDYTVIDPDAYPYVMLLAFVWVIALGDWCLGGHVYHVSL